MILTAFGWLFYFTIHSLLASARVKAVAARNFPTLNRYYRLLYNLIAIVLFVLVLTLQKRQPQTAIFPQLEIIRWLSIGLVIAGGLVIFLSFRGYSVNEFLGITTSKSVSPQLNVRGLNSVVRHPIYLGTLIFLIGVFGYDPTVHSLIFVIIAVAYLFVGSALEERKLVQTFGRKYEEYRKSTPGIVPWFRRKPLVEPDELKV